MGGVITGVTGTTSVTNDVSTVLSYNNSTLTISAGIIIGADSSSSTYKCLWCF